MIDRYDLAGVEDDEWLTKQDYGDYVLYEDFLKYQKIQDEYIEMLQNNIETLQRKLYDSK